MANQPLSSSFLLANFIHLADEIMLARYQCRIVIHEQVVPIATALRIAFRAFVGHSFPLTRPDEGENSVHLGFGFGCAVAQFHAPLIKRPPQLLFGSLVQFPAVIVTQIDSQVLPSITLGQVWTL